MRICAIIPAAGKGRRIRNKIRKPFLLLEGKPIIAYTLEKFQNCGLIDEIYLILPEENVDYGKQKIVKPYGFNKVKKILAGGKERQDSVYQGLKNIPEKTELIVIHDGVRPFLKEKMIEESVKTALQQGGAVAAIPEKDTIKEVSAEGLIIRTLPREKLYKIQTPQTFKKDLLFTAFQKAQAEDYYATDEASLVERLGIRVGIVKGSEFNLKITTPEDLILAKAILTS